MARTNLVPNPSFENGLDGWTAFGDATLSVSSVANTGSQSVQVTNLDEDQGIMSAPIPVVGGERYYLSMAVQFPAGVSGFWQGFIEIRWYDANGTRVHPTGLPRQPFGSNTPIPLGQWKTQAVTTGSNPNPAAPSAATTAQLILYVSYGSMVGQTFLVDSVLFEPTAESHPAYFDGDSPGARWIGTPHASASTDEPLPEPDPDPIAPPTDETTLWYDFADGVPEVFTGDGFAGSGDGPGAITTIDDRTGLAPDTYMQVGSQQHNVSLVTTKHIEVGTGGGTVEFWVRRESENGYDFNTFKIDGVIQYNVSGSQPWTNVAYPLAAGTHTLEWGYTSDGSVAHGIGGQRVTALTITNAQVAEPEPEPTLWYDFTFDTGSGLDGWTPATGTNVNNPNSDGMYWYASDTATSGVYRQIDGLVAGNTYTFVGTIRADWGGGYSLAVDDIDGSIHPDPGHFGKVDYMVAFTATATSHLLTVKAYGWGAGFLTRVRVEDGALPGAETIVLPGGGTDPEPTPTYYHGWGMPL